MDCSPPGSSVHGISQARIPIPFPRGSSWPRDWTQVSCTAGTCFTTWATREALTQWKAVQCLNTMEMPGSFLASMESEETKTEVTFPSAMGSVQQEFLCHTMLPIRHPRMWVGPHAPKSATQTLHAESSSQQPSSREWCSLGRRAGGRRSLKAESTASNPSTLDEANLERGETHHIHTCTAESYFLRSKTHPHTWKTGRKKTVKF